MTRKLYKLIFPKSFMGFQKRVLLLLAVSMVFIVSFFPFVSAYTNPYGYYTEYYAGQYTSTERESMSCFSLKGKICDSGSSCDGTEYNCLEAKHYQILAGATGCCSRPANCVSNFQVDYEVCNWNEICFGGNRDPDFCTGFCDAICKINGEWCASDNSCCSGICQEFKCAGFEEEVCGIQYDYCSSNSDCCYGLYCVDGGCEYPYAHETKTCSQMGGFICEDFCWASEDISNLDDYIPKVSSLEGNDCCVGGYCITSDVEYDFSTDWDEYCADKEVGHPVCLTPSEPKYYKCQPEFFGTGYLAGPYDCKSEGSVCSDGYSCFGSTGMWDNFKEGVGEAVEGAVNKVGEVVGSATVDVGQGFLKGLFGDINFSTLKIIFYVIAGLLILFLFGRFLFPLVSLLFSPLASVLKFISLGVLDFTRTVSRGVMK